MTFSNHSTAETGNGEGGHFFTKTGSHHDTAIYTEEPSTARADRGGAENPEIHLGNTKISRPSSGIGQTQADYSGDGARAADTEVLGRYADTSQELSAVTGLLIGEHHVSDTSGAVSQGGQSSAYTRTAEFGRAIDAHPASATTVVGAPKPCLLLPSSQLYEVKDKQIMAAKFRKGKSQK